MIVLTSHGQMNSNIWREKYVSFVYFWNKPHKKYYIKLKNITLGWSLVHI